ncbi:hypothetical protein B0A49_12513 [Cryomyces minteri]|uniref:Uncharacterized protein n=2 Tax=Cryomyces minteri TaxID=331657 RepID=A0A4U0VP65_9PEZI|nr:hypothetical protein B0A49_12513 [Cryomyces minteri]
MQNPTSLHVLLLFILSLFSQVWGQAPYDPSPFDIIGTINGMTLDPSGGTLAGGSITVDGVAITVPTNLLATLPAITVAWGELFNNGVPDLPGGMSWQAHVQGNRVKDQYIAGLVYITQNFAQTTQGFINYIDVTTGHFRLGGVMGSATSGIDCVINDPVGRFALPYTANPLWTSDPDNPSIHTVHGFPVCIPRSVNDPLCPAKNRPLDAAGKPSTAFNFKDPATVTATDPDPRLMVPLVQGDYVTVTGVEVGGGLLAVNALTANLGIFTAPGTKPAYVTCESALFGIVSGNGAGEIPETRAVAWTTDPTTTLQWFAIDVDPCTGAATERNILLMQPNDGVAAVPKGRAVYRMGKTAVTPATRQVGFRLSDGTSSGASNITAGQFIQPIFDYIFPELLAVGNPTLPNAFDVITYLAKGGGPYVPGKPGAASPATPVVVGQLSPWPGAPTPAATVCPVPTGPPPVSPPANPTPAPSPTPGTPKDIVTISSASQRAQRGAITVTVNAVTNDLTAVLQLSVAGPNPISNQNMINNGGGSFFLP